MRHYLRAGPITTLSFGVGVSARATGLIATAGSKNGALTGLPCACGCAVAVATIAVAANNYGGVAPHAQVASSGSVHWQWWANGVRPGTLAP